METILPPLVAVLLIAVVARWAVSRLRGPLGDVSGDRAACPDADGSIAETTEMTPALSAALVSFQDFLESDDAKRGDDVDGSDTDTLRALVDTVEPLFPELNAVLDRLGAMPHPIATPLEYLESDLHSLAQAAMEADLVLRERSGA